VSHAFGRQIALSRLRQWQFAEVVFNNRFPKRYHTQINIIARVTNDVLPPSRKSCISADELEKNMRIKQKFHFPSNAFTISSGKGASKSSGTVNSPAHKPNGRKDSVRDINGLTSATGFPVRIIIIVRRRKIME